MKAVRVCKFCHAVRLEDGKVEHRPYCPFGDGYYEPSKPYRQPGVNGASGGGGYPGGGGGGGGSGGGGDDGEPNWPIPPTLPKPGGTALPLPEPTRKIEHKPILALPMPEAKEHGEEMARLRLGKPAA